MAPLRMARVGRARPAQLRRSTGRRPPRWGRSRPLSTTARRPSRTASRGGAAAHGTSAMAGQLGRANLLVFLGGLAAQTRGLRGARDWSPVRAVDLRGSRAELAATFCMPPCSETSSCSPATRSQAERVLRDPVEQLERMRDRQASGEPGQRARRSALPPGPPRRGGQVDASVELTPKRAARFLRGYPESRRSSEACRVPRRSRPRRRPCREAVDVAALTARHEFPRPFADGSRGSLLRGGTDGRGHRSRGSGDLAIS